MEDDRIGVVQEVTSLSRPGLNRSVGHVPRKERRRWNAILRDSRCGQVAPITDSSACPLEAEELSGEEDETKREAHRRRDSWDQEEYTEVEVQAGWAALEQMKSEDDSGLRDMKSAIGAQDWTPRHNFSKPGRPAAATGGLWALGSPESLVDRIKAMAEGDFLVVATDGALVKVMENTTGGWKSVPHMGGGWVIGIALKGTNVELAGEGRVEWVAAGAVRVQLTSWGVKASSYLAESGGMVAVMRALTQVSMDLSPDIQARRPDIAQYCDSLSLVRSIEGRMMLDVKAARNSATRVWWPQIAMMMRWWRKSGAKWGINWRRGHVERREKNSARWAPADWGNVIADVVAGRGWAAGATLLPNDQGFSSSVTPPGWALVWSAQR